jgi:hypothetical protein
MNRSSSLLSLAISALLFAPAGASAESPAATPGYPEPVVQWGVQKDETCEDIAKALYGSAKHATLALRYNRVDCSRGKKLKEGTTLVMPAAVTSLPTARLKSLNPDVKARPGGGSWAPAAAGQALSTSSGVNTLESGRADIEFIDRTRVFLASNTLVIIYGTASQSAVSKTPPPAVEVQSGEVMAGLAALRGETVEVAIQGGGRVSASSRETIVQRKGERNTVGVYDGKATVKSGGKTVEVPLNHGTRFTGADPPAPPRPLPPAPVWDSAMAPFVVAGTEGGTIRADWAEVKDAKSYRVEIARDDAFRDLIAREEIAGSVRSFRAEKLPPGRYHVAVRAIDKDEYLGVAAKREVNVVAIDRGAKAPAPTSSEIAVNPYAVIGLNDGDRKLDFAIDDGPFGPMPKTLDLSKGAPDKLHFRPQGAGPAHAVVVRYTPVGATVKAELAKDSKTADVEIVFTGLEGIDIAERVGPVLRVTEGESTHSVALTSTGSRWLASVPAPAEGRAVRLDVLDGRGTILGTSTLERLRSEALASPAPRPKVPAIGLTTESWQPSPVTGVMLWSPTARNAASASVQTAMNHSGALFRFQGAASGGVGPVGVDASIRSGVFGDEVRRDDNAWLGARLRAMRLGAADFELGFAARFGVPVTSLGPDPRFEPSIALGGVRGRYTFLANLGLRIRMAQGGVDTPDGHGFVLAGATVSALSWLRFGAMLDAHVVHFETRSTVARAGLSLQAEAGTFVYGALSLRISPWDDDAGALVERWYSGQLALGLRIQ